MSSFGDATIPATRRPRQSVSSSSPSKKAMDKENATVDVTSTLAANRKKSRSKSMGPGGFDVLRSGNGNRRVSLAAPSRPPPRSILKPTMPLLPEIPPHKSRRPSASGDQENSENQPTMTGSQDLSNPFNNDDPSDASGTKVALRTEEEQQAAAREREERERAELEKEIRDRREARRKSLANRRVSFATEATLHTFHVEYMQDSTTSTDSTRRASSVAGRSPAPSAHDHPRSDASEPPSTPPEQSDDGIIGESPADQRDFDQEKHRRSSGIPSLDFNPDDDTIASTVYSSDSEHGDGIIEEIEEASESSDSDSDDDGTVMTMDAEEITSASVASARSASSADSTSGLDEALRLAAQRAGTQTQINNDELDEDEEAVPAIVGWGKSNKSQINGASAHNDTTANMFAHDGGSNQDDEATATMDMQITRAMGGIITERLNSPDADQEGDMSMDVTRAVGGIIRPNQSSPKENQDEEMSMDMTHVIGGILPANMGRQTSQLVVRQAPGKIGSLGAGQPGTENPRLSIGSEGNDDMSMELTTAMGGVLSSGPAGKQTRRRTIKSTQNPADDETTMDMTVAVGRILPSKDTVSESNGENETMGMDMTMALGGIIKDQSPASKEGTVDKTNGDSGQSSTPTPRSKRRSLPKPNISATTDQGIPGISAFQGKGLHRTPNRRASASQNTAQEKTPSPPKQASEHASGPRTPGQTLPTKYVGSRSTSPRRPAQAVAQTTPRSASKSKPETVFHQDPITGGTTPRVILTPQRRRLSGVGADRSGLGSPKVAEMLNRRGSIGDISMNFVPGHGNDMPRRVVFEDPRVMEQELDKERQDEEDKENRRKIVEREAERSQDEREATLNLKEMIQGLSPKKNILQGRKSLHVGSAKGLLGKRPAELDDDEELEEQDGVKRLKGLQGSPVKNIHLQQPPSKAETTGRLMRSADGPSTHTPTLGHSPKKAGTLKDQGRFRDLLDDQPSMTVDFDAARELNEAALRADDDEDRIHLQDFLNMTSIRFMELTTTKRRHTVVPSAPRDSSSGDDKDVSLERCVVAGACTVPMLELYQHSCRELKKYISEGRRIVREIETETFEENPPLFREYISASPDFKILMDNQFKNVKTHARFLSKAMWYEWRMKLQDGLKEGLLRTGEGMASDDKRLRKQQDLLDSVVPALVKQYEELEREHQDLETFAHELADCNPDDLEAARSELVAVDDDIEAKMQKIAELRQQLQETESSIGELSGQKQHCLDEIKEAQKIREECRGWSSTEISALKARVERLEKQHGWAITGIAGTTVSMTYLREIELVFDISSFQPGKPNSRIDLWYIGGNRERDPEPPTPERDFFLQCIRDCVRGLPQSQTTLSRMLGMVCAAWDKACAVANQVRLLNVAFPTHTARITDSSIAIRSSLLMVPLESKVDIVLNLHSHVAADGVEVSIVPQASVVYGEQFNAAKMAEFLATRIGDRARGKGEKETESWSDVVVELHARLLARGRK